MPHHFRRRNPTAQRLQELERLAGRGDRAAAGELLNARFRAGLLTIDWLRRAPMAVRDFLPDLPIGWLAEAGPEFFAYLPQHVRHALLEAAAIQEMVQDVGMSFVETGRGGWFSGHTLQDICPRGHRLGARMGGPRSGRVSFEAVALGYIVRDVADALPDSIVIEGLCTASEDIESVGTIVVCAECWAGWPAANVNYV